ncbi:MAG: hypothetical protein U0840_10755 [Gemmataceae bacterium]
MARERKRATLEGKDDVYIVDGRVIHPDLDTPLRYIGGGGVTIGLSLAGLAVIARMPLLILKGRLIAFALLGLISLVGGVGVFFGLVLRNRRLIVGEDRLQLVGAGGRVLGQLPYDNILDMHMGVETSVEITLDTTRRRDTWWPRWEDRDCDVRIKPTVESDATALRLYLRDALREYRHRHGGPAWQRD